jgi:hypothetical protein
VVTDGGEEAEEEKKNDDNGVRLYRVPKMTSRRHATVWRSHVERNTTSSVPRSRPKAAGDEREVAPYGWKPILKYLQKCH